MRTVFRSTASLLIGLICSSVMFAQSTWEQQPTALPSNPTTFVQVGGLWGIAMTDTGTGFAAGYASVSNGFSGVLRKLPGNPTWFVLPASSFSGLAASHSLWSGVSAVGTHAWVCGSNGRLYRTTDNGTTWNAATTGMTGTNSLFDVFFKSQTEGMAVGDDGTMYYTSNGGANWTAQTLPGTVPATTRLYAVHSAGANWYVSGAAGTFMRGTPATSSTSWVDLSANLPALGDIEGVQFLDNLTGTVSGATVGGSAIYRTTNGGSSFTAIGSGLPTGQDYKTLHFFTSAHGWTGNSSGPLYETTNTGQNWNSRNTTTLPSQNLSGWLTRVDFPSAGIGYASGGAPGTSSLGWILRYDTPLVPDISSTPTSLDFGTVECDTTTTEQFTIENTGTANLTIASITFSAPEFTLASSLPTPIPPSGGATISVRWTPAQAGSIPPNTTMTIASNDPSNPTWTVDLSGTYNFGTFGIGTSYSFSDACVGDSSDVVVNVTVTGNLSPELISFQHVSGDDNVELSSPALGTTISGSTQLVFRFKPSSGGAMNGVYRLVYGNPSCPRSVDITFTGTAYNAALSLNPPIVDFGDVCAGEIKTLEVTVTNNGTTDGVISLRQFAGGKDAFPNMHPTPFGPIPPGQSRQYTVRFAPGSNDTGNIEGLYRLIVDPCKDTLMLTLRGRGVSPAVSFIPTTVLAIGPTGTGQIIDEPVQINNDGNSAVTITSITLNPPHPRLTLRNLPVLPLVLPAGQSTSVTVRFAPDRPEQITTKLCVHWSDPCADSSCLAVGATSGESPAIAVDTVHDVGIQRCATPLLDTLMVYNTGKGTLTLRGFSLGGANPAHFSVVSPSVPHAVNPGDSVAVVLSYDAPANGSSSAVLTIEHNDANAGLLTDVALTGERRTVRFAVEGDTTTAYVSCAHVGKTRTLSIRNQDPDPLEIRDISVIDGSDVFHVASTPLPASVPGGSALSFEVNFTPTGKGIFTGVLRITAGPCPDTYLVALRGEGNITELSFSPSPVDFGAVMIGSPATRTVRVGNTGSAPLRITGAFLQAGAIGMSILSPPAYPVTVGGGQFQEFTLRFDPASVQTVLSSFCVTVEAPCPDTLCVNVSGRGASTGVGLTRTSIEYQLDPCTAGERCDSLRIVNNAGQNVEIRAVRIEPPGGFRIEMSRTPPFTLNSGVSADVRICAIGDFTGSRTAGLVVESDDPNTPLLRMPLTARRDSSGFALAENSLDFGAIADCEIGVSRLVTLTNTGTLAEFIDTLRGSDAFLVTTTLPVAVQASGLTQVRITFDPPGYGVFTDTLYFTSARCGTRVPMFVRGAYYETNYTVSPDPLAFGDIALGSSDTRNLTLENLHLPNVRIADVRIEPAGTAFASWGAYPKTVSAGNATGLPILFNPQTPGTHSATACIIIDQPCRDTICVDLTGGTSEALITADPDTLRFGDVAQCAELRDTVLIRNNGNDPVTLTAAQLSGADAALFLLVNPLTSPVTLAAQEGHAFVVQTVTVTAPADGAKQAELLVETDNSSQSELRIPVVMQRVTLQMPDDVVVDFGPVLVGGQYPRTLQFLNPGSQRIDFRTADLPIDLQLDTPLPLVVDPGMRGSIDIVFAPTAAGAYLDTLILRHIGQCEAEFRIIIRANVRESISADNLDFGVVPNCRSSRTVTSILNSLDEDVTIAAVRIEGSDASFFRILQPADFPVSIASGNTLTVEAELTPAVPSARIYTAEAVFTIPFGQETREFRIPMTGESSDIALTPATATDFGDITIESVSMPLTLTLRNEHPFPVRVTDISAIPQEFSIVSVSPALPATVAPGETMTVDVTFAPMLVGDVTGALTLVYSEPCEQTSDILLRGRGVDDRLRTGLRIEAHEGRVDDIIDVPILLTGSLGGADVRSWQGGIRFNRTMLYPLELIGEGTLSSDMSLEMTWDGAEGVLSISGSGGALQAGTGALAIVRFQVLVGDALNTALRIEPDFVFTGGRALVESRTDGSFTLIDFCDADGLRLVRPQPVAKLTAQRPNPFSTRTVIEYDLTADGRVRLSLFDRMGREIAVLVDEPQTAGAHRSVLEGARLAPGIYFIVLRSHGHTAVEKIMRLDERR